MQEMWIQSLVQEDWRLQSNLARAPQLLSLRSRAQEPRLLTPRAATTENVASQLLKPLSPRAQAPQPEKSLQQEARAR